MMKAKTKEETEKEIKRRRVSQMKAIKKQVDFDTTALKACKAAIKYHHAIESCANDPKRITKYNTVQGTNLDALYFKWIALAIKTVTIWEEKPIKYHINWHKI